MWPQAPHMMNRRSTRLAKESLVILHAVLPQMQVVVVTTGSSVIVPMSVLVLC